MPRRGAEGHPKFVADYAKAHARFNEPVVDLRSRHAGPARFRRGADVVSVRSPNVSRLWRIIC